MGVNGLKVFGRAGVCTALFLSFATTAAAQVQERPKTIPPQQGQAAPATPKWSVVCSNTQAGLQCTAAQAVVLQQGGRNIRVTAAFQIDPQTKTPKLVLQLPLGVYLPTGVTVRFGDGSAKALAFQACNQNGCVAEHAITGPEIATLAKEVDLTLSLRTPDKKVLTITVPAAGFAAAYGKADRGIEGFAAARIDGIVDALDPLDVRTEPAEIAKIEGDVGCQGLQ